MYPRQSPFALSLMLAAILLRTVLGAPCCADMFPVSDHAEQHAKQMEGAHHDHAEHARAAEKAGGHAGHHDGDASANPCCSACGPTLPPELAELKHASLGQTLPEPTPVRELATRPPFPAYNATGPPLLI